MTFNFSLSETDFNLVEKIATRFQKRVDVQPFRTTLMDLIVCQNHACPLALDLLLVADDSNFFHDVAGIVGHINRETGELDDCFTPRYAAANHVRDASSHAGA